MKIPTIEDDTLLLQGLILTAQTENYACDGMSTVRAVEQCLEIGHYSLVALDLGSSDEDGLCFLTRIRQKKYSLLVLILTVRDMLKNRVNGPDVGADDYLVRPFALEGLHTHIRALLCRHNNRDGSELTASNLTLNIGRRQVWMDGQEIILTPKEYVLLSRLMLKADSSVRREILYNDIYSWDNESSTNMLGMYIHNLRDKVEKLRTHAARGFGYMLVTTEES